MDKNTLNGLLLMFAVFALFMWLTPKEQAPQQDAPGPDVTTETPVATTVDALSPTEKDWLVQNIAANGRMSVAAERKISAAELYISFNYTNVRNELLARARSV